MDLSDRHRLIVEFIDAYLKDNDCSPSQREIASAARYQSVGALAPELHKLRNLGYIEWQPGRPRTIKVVHALLDGEAANPEQEPSTAADAAASAGGFVLVPMLGSISAGKPISAQEDVEFVVPLPPLLVGDGELFLLRVQGHSMRDAGILNGDMVVVRRQDSADYGSTVAALIENEATVKVLSRRAGRVWLDACNPNYGPIPGDQASVLGVVVAVLRSVKPTSAP